MISVRNFHIHTHTHTHDIVFSPATCFKIEGKTRQEILQWVQKYLKADCSLIPNLEEFSIQFAKFQWEFRFSFPTVNKLSQSYADVEQSLNSSSSSTSSTTTTTNNSNETRESSAAGGGSNNNNTSCSSSSSGSVGKQCLDSTINFVHETLNGSINAATEFCLEIKACWSLPTEVSE